MIQINSFIPTDNFTRRIWEFHEDKIVIKTKSLTVDIEKEVKYEKIKFIESRKSANLYWIWVSFFIFAILSITTLGIDYFGERNTIVDSIEKVVAFFALSLILPSFRKNEYLYFIDAEKNYSTNIKIDNDKKRAQIAEAINLIKQRTNIIAETYLSDTLPKENPTFEIVEFDFPDFLNKSTTRFYEDRIIETYKSLTQEAVRITKYDELNGATKTAKLGNDNWNYVWSYWLIFVCITSLSTSIFFFRASRWKSILRKICLWWFCFVNSNVFFEIY